MIRFITILGLVSILGGCGNQLERPQAMLLLLENDHYEEDSQDSIMKEALLAYDKNMDLSEKPFVDRFADQQIQTMIGDLKSSVGRKEWQKAGELSAQIKLLIKEENALNEAVVYEMGIE